MAKFRVPSCSFFRTKWIEVESLHPRHFFWRLSLNSRGEPVYLCFSHLCLEQSKWIVLSKSIPLQKKCKIFYFLPFLFLNFRALIFVWMIVKIFEIVQIYYILLYRFNGTIVEKTNRDSLLIDFWLSSRNRVQINR